MIPGFKKLIYDLKKTFGVGTFVEVKAIVDKLVSDLI